MTVRAILFDKDGTLLDFEATWGALFEALALDLAGGDEKRAAAMLLAGGYAPTPEETADLHAVVHRQARLVYG